jgi:hypothetical protein
MKRSLFRAAVLGGLLMFAPVPAANAGGSIIDFPSWVVVGTSVTGHGSFGAGQQESVSAGPWYAVLVRAGDRDGTPVMRLGQVQIENIDGGWRATTSFVVPDVPTGEYSIWVQNAAGDGVGDLTGGWTVIAHTSAEGRLFVRARDTAFVLRNRERSIAALRTREDGLRQELAERNGTIGRQEGQLDAVTARARWLDAQLNAARASDDVPVWPFVLAGAGTLLLAGIAFELGRRTPRVRTVFDEGTDPEEAHATRTLVTGASRSWTENHDDPESGEPKTSPLVAPK